jgi:hypothetical protein
MGVISHHSENTSVDFHHMSPSQKNPLNCKKTAKTRKKSSKNIEKSDCKKLLFFHFNRHPNFGFWKEIVKFILS